MWVSDRWKDYELIDCSGGERLERWGRFFVIRPDPQVIWDTPRRHPAWNRADAKYTRVGGGGSWHKNELPEKWEITYSELKFYVKPMNFKHTGLFPEQAANWDYIREKISAAKREIRVLNLFAYTGGATAAALSAGAEVCHVDAAKGMVAWAKENMRLSGLSDRPVRYIIDDCVKFIAREARRGNKYDAVIMDPPSYGRGPGGEIWKLSDSFFKLLTSCADILSDNPLFFIINSYTTGLSPSVLTYAAETALSRFGGRAESRELGLRVNETGLFLPCGASCRWCRGDY